MLLIWQMPACATIASSSAACGRVEVVVLDDPLQQLAVRLPRAPLERLAGDDRGQLVGRLEPRPLIDAGRSRGSALAVTRAPHLGRPDDLAVAHQRLAVAEVEAGAVVRDGQHERRAGAQLAAVHVAAVAALELGVQLALGRRDREAADQRPRRQRRPLVEAQDAVLDRVDRAGALVVPPLVRVLAVYAP